MILGSCYTISGPSPNSWCVFPFKYKDKEYSSCTYVDAVDGRPWCSVKVDTQGDVITGVSDQWGHCNDACFVEGMIFDFMLNIWNGIILWFISKTCFAGLIYIKSNYRTMPTRLERIQGIDLTSTGIMARIGLWWKKSALLWYWLVQWMPQELRNETVWERRREMDTKRL